MLNRILNIDMYFTFILGLICFVIIPAKANRLEEVRNKLGGDFRIIVFSDDNADLKKTLDEAYDLVDRINASLNEFNESSELQILNNLKRLDNPSADMLTVMEFSQKAFKQTDAYFDISVGPLICEWDKAEMHNKRPSQKRLKKLEQSIGLTSCLLECSAQAIQIKTESSITLAGIAKGYIIDCVYDFLRERAYKNFLIEAAGDVRVSGKPIGADKWLVGVSSGARAIFTVALKSGQAIATSGNTYRYRMIDGVKYSHIINPKTLVPVKHNNTSTAIAESAMKADYIASTLNVIESMDEVEAIFCNDTMVHYIIFNESEVQGRSHRFPFF